MSESAAFTAAQPNSSLKASGVALQTRTTPQYVCPTPTLCGVIAASFRAAVVTDWCRRNPAHDRGACECFPSRIPSSARDHASGPLRRPAARRRSASAPHPPTQRTRVGDPDAPPLWGLGTSQNKFENPGGERRSNFFRAPPRMHFLGTWEPGPLAGVRQGDPSRIREIQRNGDHHHV